MQQYRKARHLPSKAVLVTACLAAVIVIALATTRLTHTWPFQKPLTTAQLNAQRQKTDYPSPKNNNPPSKGSTSAPPTGGQTSDEVPVDPQLSADITQLQETNGQVTFEATVHNTTESAGTCVVTFSNPNDRPVTQQFAAKNDGTDSTCGPVTISADEFSYLGSWQVDFHYYVGDTQAEAQSEITIK